MGASLDGEADVEQAIRDLLVAELGVSVERVAACGPSTPLLGRGIGLDSIEAMTLATALESRFRISITDDELDQSTFATLASLTQLVAGKLR